MEKSENIKMKRFLIVAPLNTVLNWEQEYEKWLNVEDRMDVSFSASYIMVEIRYFVVERRDF